ELSAAQAALVDAERLATMGKTSAAIAHELKNAMGGLGMAVDLILQDPTASRGARLRQQVLAAIPRRPGGTDALLAVARAPRSAASEEDLVRLVYLAVASLADVIADRAADVTIDAPAPILVRCDGHKIQSVVVNLVKNAVEAGQHVRVRAAAADGAA